MPLPGMSPEDIARLERIPWAAALLADKSFVLAPTSSRQPKQSGEDSFVAETLNSSRAIRAWVTQHSLPLENEKPSIREIRSFLDLGDGLNGYPAVMHGGMIATLLDEVTGVLLTINLDHDNRIPIEERGLTTSIDSGLASMTAYLNVSYKKPVPLPGIVLGTAKFVKFEGRKSYVRGTLEDGNGTVYAVGEALFVEVKPRI
ncbi:Thioesterase superfamily [Neofusicoccum parvum]|uniref:Thioesterase domain-containing protein n=3 Tax=Neofusicoccum TaxID=407951 RepID=A0ABR3TEE4_9PEZI|nr:putative thioesterase superfamily protein [Neofusicoccum parvum UCRNP2]GME25141.1 Thioesterase superfamily [Neofusicoccum parvum]GME58620.1 Thioesterase superfamily [Neofusicoccum parvum]